MTASSETTRRHAAQPCSYIFTQSIQLSKISRAIRITALSLSRPWAARAFLLKVQSPRSRDSTSKQTSLHKPIREGNGGAERDRTVDPLLAKQVLSQLSYSPLKVSITNRRDKVVGLGRFELPTSPLSGVRSNQLSYRPEIAALRAASST